MRIDGFDYDSGNLEKCLAHGVSPREVEIPFAGKLTIVRDRVINGERRPHGYGKAGDRRVFCVFAWRGRRVRPISVRCMHAKEVGKHAKTNS